MNRFLLISQCVVFFAVCGNIMGVGADDLGPTSKDARDALNHRMLELQGLNSGTKIQEEFKVDTLKGSDGIIHDHVYFISISKDDKLIKLELIEILTGKTAKTIASIEASTIKTSGKDIANKKLTLAAGNAQYELVFDRKADIEVLEKFSQA